jgi:hypothetical protein
MTFGMSCWRSLRPVRRAGTRRETKGYRDDRESDRMQIEIERFPYHLPGDGPRLHGIYWLLLCTSRWKLRTELRTSDARHR